MPKRSELKKLIFWLVAVMLLAVLIKLGLPQLNWKKAVVVAFWLPIVCGIAQIARSSIKTMRLDATFGADVDWRFDPIRQWYSEETAARQQSEAMTIRGAAVLYTALLLGCTLQCF